MSICPTIDFNQSVEDRAARQTSPLHVFDVRVEFAVSLPDPHPQMWIAKTEGRQAMQSVARRMNAIVDGRERFTAIRRRRVDINPKFSRAMKRSSEMGKRQCKDHGVSPWEWRVSIETEASGLLTGLRLGARRQR